MKRVVVVLALVSLFAACTSTATMPAGTDAAIRGMAEAFETAARARSVERVAAFYAEDAVLMPPNAANVTGRAAIGQFWGAMLAAPAIELDLITENVQGCGDLAVERGRYEFTAPVQDSGKYVVVWRNAGGQWQIVTDMFSSSVALPSR
ncbi:MAG TPA: DUF4440 domain-containing protein [Thermoanaerobaculia bacterium]|nr:DUF4440 domain-containing protein [Thermoanaerobaculia bacterium]